MSRSLALRRGGFTLLELILALSIALVLLGALYMSMNGQLRLAQGGRDLVEKGTLGRSLLTRMTNDITCHLAPTNPWLRSKFPAAPTTSDSPSTTPSTSTTDPATEETTPPEDAQTPMSDVPAEFNRGLLGGPKSISLFITKYTRELDQDPEKPVADVRRIDYWLVEEGERVGLARRQVTLVTSEEQYADPYTLPEQEKYIIAKEVKGLTFRYWNGSDWQDTWDGLTPGVDENQTPLGPPAAIEITIEVQAAQANGEEPRLLRYRHVVPIPTANIVSNQ